VEKLFYLPEAHTDFLMAVIAEELGWSVVTAVIMLFALLVVRAFRLAARQRFSSAIFSAGRTGHRRVIGVQAMINIGVNMGCCRPKV